MNTTLSTALLLFVSACSVPAVPALPVLEYPMPPQHGARHIHRTVAPATPVPSAAVSPTPAIPAEKPHVWDITEDRFITTHKPDVSVEALGLTHEQIDNRLIELDK